MSAKDRLERDLDRLPCPIDLPGLRLFFNIVQMLREHDEQDKYAEPLSMFRMAVTNNNTVETIAEARSLLLAALQQSKHWTIYQSMLNYMSGADESPARPRRRSDFLHIMQQIVPGLYIGGISAAQNWHGMKRADITHVVCLLPMQPLFPADFKYLQLDVDDSIREDMYTHFVAINAFIQSALSSGGRALVHCGAGISRASTAVMAFLMYGSGMPLDEAYSLVKAVRPIILPNRGFLQQLRRYETEMQAAGSVAPSQTTSLAPSARGSVAPSAWPSIECVAKEVTDFDELRHVRSAVLDKPKPTSLPKVQTVAYGNGRTVSIL
eukprot:TRINITY_DN11298_c0_g1_i1.p1 TRINITY_DN11298_c0_g1~~TRINITY_DN11298_c0_g1_i1.p1  ORF type:complete len:323 (+),score=40.72 TRINITY_DN11298_c0_g1_i1:163-1131(+)